jgi:hypothetical protein
MNPIINIKICFYIKEYPFALHLQNILGYGRLNYPREGNYFTFEISYYAGLYYICLLTNGYYRTPKIKAFH